VRQTARHPLVATLLFGCAAMQPARSEYIIDPVVEGERPRSFVCVAEQLSYDSNLFRIAKFVDPKTTLGPDASRDDFIARTSACVDANWQWAQQRFRLTGSIDDNRYRHNQMLDHTSGNGKLQWDWQVGESWYGKLGGSYQHALSSFINDRPIEKDLVDSTRYFGELNKDVGTFVTLHVGGSRTETSHDTVARQVDNYRNTSGDAGITLTSRAGNYIGANYQYSKADYPDPVLIETPPITPIPGITIPGTTITVDRDYKERISLLRFSYALAPRTVLRGSGGYVSRTYAGAPDSDYSGAQWRLFLTWQPTVSTQLELSGWQQLNAYFDLEADHFVSRGFSVTPSWMPHERVKISTLFSWEKQQYLARTLAVIDTAARDDKVSTAGLDVAYRPAEWLDVGVNYKYEEHDSTLAAYKFNDQIAALQLRLRF